MKALTLQQLRGACAVVDSGFNVSRAATALHSTQSGVSKTIKALEDELEVVIFERTATRIVGPTEYGQEVIHLARDMLRNAAIMVARAQEDLGRARGELRIATTHLHARYLLPKVVQKFRSKYPEISIRIEQTDADEVARWVSSRRAHIGIGSQVDKPATLIRLNAMHLDRCIVVPPGHELLSIRSLSLADVARFPLVMHGAFHLEGVRLRQLFGNHGLELNIVATAADVTVLKEYVAAGVGIAILHKIAIRTEDEHKVAVIDASHFLLPTQTQLILRPGEYLRSYVYDFAEAFSPQWTRRSIIEEIERQSANALRSAMNSK